MDPTTSAPAARSRVGQFMTRKVWGTPAWLLMLGVIALGVIVTLIIAAAFSQREPAPTRLPAGRRALPEDEPDYGVGDEDGPTPDEVEARVEYLSQQRRINPYNFPDLPEYHTRNASGELTQAAVDARIAFIQANPHLFSSIREYQDEWATWWRNARAGGGIRQAVASWLARCDYPACAAYLREQEWNPPLTGDELNAIDSSIQATTTDRYGYYSRHRELFIDPRTGLPIVDEDDPGIQTPYDPYRGGW